MSKELEQRIIELEKEIQDYQKLRGRVSVDGLQSILFPTGKLNPNAWKKLSQKEAQSIVTYLQQPTEH